MHDVALALLQTNQPDIQQIQKMMFAIIPIFLVFFIVGVAMVVIPFWFICKKAGFSPWLSFLNIVPVGNLVLIYILAFAEWKVVPAVQTTWGPPQPYPPQPPYPPQR
jgi:hypothetical protein